MDIASELKKIKLSIQPQVLSKLLNLNSDSDGTSFAALSDVVKADQNMSTMILKAANSSFYARGNQVSSLQHAIAMLGFRVVRSLAMAANSKSLFESGKYSRFQRYVWKHSTATSVICKELASKLGKAELEEEAFVAGLLHDIGKVVLNVIDRRKFISVIDMVVEENIAFPEAEKRIFGVTHMEVGKAAAIEWKLPVLYKEVFEYHENYIEDVPSDDTLLLVVAYGNYLAKRYGYGHQSPQDDIDGEKLEKKLKLSKDHLVYFKETFKTSIEENEFFKFVNRLI
ncbi:MAG: HDOD domain-containing protein [Spirochaetia bacterium]|nr:HDOD domain-containing protein [Spirochaetia bacterium]